MKVLEEADKDSEDGQNETDIDDAESDVGRQKDAVSENDNGSKNPENAAKESSEVKCHI